MCAMRVRLLKTAHLPSAQVKAFYGSDSQLMACSRRYFAMVTMRSMAQEAAAALKASAPGPV